MLSTEITQLSAKERQVLKAKAHHLKPVVMIGHNGLTPAVLREADVALTAHELIKIRMLAGDREERANMIQALCANLSAFLVAHSGKLAIVWRENQEERVS